MKKSESWRRAQHSALADAIERLARADQGAFPALYTSVIAEPLVEKGAPSPHDYAYAIAQRVVRFLDIKGWRLTYEPIPPAPHVDDGGSDMASVIRSIRHHLAIIRISDNSDLLAIADDLTLFLDRLASP